jgi:hypothetical protein
MIYQIKHEIEVEKEIKVCLDCRFEYMDDNGDCECIITENDLSSQHRIKEKPSWCPLKKVEVTQCS